MKTVRQIVVHAKPGCSCLEQALTTLQRAGCTPLVETWEPSSPTRLGYPDASLVVAVDGKVRFVDRVDPLLLQRLLDVGVESERQRTE